LQAQRQAAQRQAGLGQQQQQQQQQQPVSVSQSSRPMSAAPQQGIQPIMQAQQQLQLQAPHQQHQQQQQAVSAQVMSAGRRQPVQNHTLQQIQEMQAELKQRQEQAQRHNQGHPGAGQVDDAQGQGQGLMNFRQAQGQVSAGPGPSQPGPQQDQGKLGTALGQRQQGHTQRVLPQSMPGQAPAALGQIMAGQPPVSLPQSQHNAVVSSATSSTASARPPASQQGLKCSAGNCLHKCYKAFSHACCFNLKLPPCWSTCKWLPHQLQRCNPLLSRQNCMFAMHSEGLSQCTQLPSASCQMLPACIHCSCIAHHICRFH